MSWPLPLSAGQPITAAYLNSIVTALSVCQGTLNVNGQTITNVGAISGALSITGALTVGAGFTNLTVSGASTLSGAVTIANALGITGAVNIGGTGGSLSLVGSSYFSMSSVIANNSAGAVFNPTVSSSGGNITVGVYIVPKSTSASGVGQNYGTYSSIQLAGSFTEPTVGIVCCVSPQLSGGALITNCIGLNIQAQKITGVTNGYGIYQRGGSDINYFAGPIGIGTNAPTSPMHIVGLPTYASDSAAGSGGLTTGALYKDSSGGLHVKL